MQDLRKMVDNIILDNISESTIHSHNHITKTIAKLTETKKSENVKNEEDVNTETK